MDKGNKNRIIFWGLIALLLIISFTIGIISYNNGYGKYGKIKKELNPIIEKFNSLEEIQKFKTVDIEIKASFEKDKINVIYKVEDLLVEYYFNYIKDNNRLLIANYDNAKYDNINNLIIKLMIQAVSLVNNHDKDEIFENFTIEDFKNTTIEEGINIKTINNENTIIINLDTYLLDNVEIEEKEEEIIDYLTKEQLDDIINTEKNTISYNDANVIIKINKNIGMILVKDLGNNDNKTYRLVQYIIDILYNDKLDTFKTEYPNITKEKYNSENFTILYLNNISDKDFINQSDILEIIIK